MNKILGTITAIEKTAERGIHFRDVDGEEWVIYHWNHMEIEEMIQEFGGTAQLFNHPMVVEFTQHSWREDALAFVCLIDWEIGQVFLDDAEKNWSVMI